MTQENPTQHFPKSHANFSSYNHLRYVGSIINLKNDFVVTGVMVSNNNMDALSGSTSVLMQFRAGSFLFSSAGYSNVGSLLI
jgi:hypothetical protein